MGGREKKFLDTQNLDFMLMKYCEKSNKINYSLHNVYFHLVTIKESVRRVVFLLLKTVLDLLKHS